MIARFVLGGAVAIAAAIACAVVAVRNFREWRTVRRLPPLVEDEVLRAEPAVALPDTWRRPEDITRPEIAAGWRDLSYKRRNAWASAGEAILLVAGAALGALLPDTMKDAGHSVTTGAVVGAGGFGIMLRRYGEEWFSQRARLYERRRAELLAVPPEPPRRRRWFGR